MRAGRVLTRDCHSTVALHRRRREQAAAACARPRAVARYVSEAARRQTRPATLRQLAWPSPSASCSCHELTCGSVTWSSRCALRLVDGGSRRGVAPVDQTQRTGGRGLRSVTPNSIMRSTGSRGESLRISTAALVTEPLTAVGAGDEAGDVVEGDRVGDDLRCPHGLRYGVEPWVGHWDHGDVGLDRREWIVGRLGGDAGQRAEQRRFAGVRHADDPDVHRRAVVTLAGQEACSAVGENVVTASLSRTRHARARAKISALMSRPSGGTRRECTRLVHRPRAQRRV